MGIRRIDQCSECGRTMPIVARRLCGACYVRQDRNKDRTKSRANARAFYARHKEELKPKKNLIYRNNYYKTKLKRIEKVYGIPKEQYEQFVKEQNGRCAICNKESSKLAVDHSHTNGQVRGLLCTPCNTSLGTVERVGVSAYEKYRT